MAASFFDGLRRLFALDTRDEEAMRETKDECFMSRLSRLVERNESVTAASARNVFDGARGWIWPVTRWWRRVRAEGFLRPGGWGA